MVALPPSDAPATRRLPIIDAARAVALLAMACFHALWDLGNVRLTAENYAATPSGAMRPNGSPAHF